MRRLPLFVLLLLVVCPVALDAAPGKVTLLTGANNDLIDRPAIQAAIDAAPKNGTVRLQGTFQLDGVEIFVRRGHLTIEGVALDNDGDHRTNEDWADGSDNDNDGAIDEDDYDAVLQGVLDGFGAPDLGTFPPQPGSPGRSGFNRGIAVQGVENVTVRDLKFTGMTRGVAFSGDIEVYYGFYCDDITYSLGPAKNSTAERNLFDNMVRGVQVFGLSHNVRILDNVMINPGANAPILTVGGSSACWLADETASSVPVGPPTGTQISGNYVAHRDGFVVQVWGSDSTRIRDNVLEDVGRHLLIVDSPKSLVIGNTMLSPRLPYNIIISDSEFGSSAGTVIQNNVVDSFVDEFDVGFAAFLLEEYTNGVKAGPNTIFGSMVHYILEEFSTKNTVLLLSGQTAWDNGTDNKVVGGGS